MTPTRVHTPAPSQPTPTDAARRDDKTLVLPPESAAPIAPPVFARPPALFPSAAPSPQPPAWSPSAWQGTPPVGSPSEPSAQGWNVPAPWPQSPAPFSGMPAPSRSGSSSNLGLARGAAALLGVAVLCGLAYGAKRIIGYVEAWREARVATQTDAISEIDRTIRARADDVENRMLVCLGPALHATVNTVSVQAVQGDGRNGRARASISVACLRPNGTSDVVFAGLSFRYTRGVREFEMNDVVSYAPSALGNTMTGDFRMAQRDDDGPLALFGYELRAGQTVTFHARAGASTLCAGRSVALQLALERDGHVLAHVDAPSGDGSLVFVAPATDVYVFAVASADPDDVGSFTLDAQQGAATQ